MRYTSDEQTAMIDFGVWLTDNKYHRNPINNLWYSDIHSNEFCFDEKSLMEVYCDDPFRLKNHVNKIVMATEEQDRIDQIMSKRDEIAGMCMASMMAKQLDVMASNPTGVISGIAFMSIKAADMLVSALIATPYQKPNTEAELKF